MNEFRFYFFNYSWIFLLIFYGYLIIKLKRFKLESLIIGIFLSILDMIFMKILWFIPFTLIAFLLGLSLYGASFILLLNLNNLKSKISLSIAFVIIATIFERILIPKYPVEYWNSTLSFIYFCMMLSLGWVFFFFIEKVKKKPS